MGRYVGLLMLAVGLSLVVACGSGGAPTDQDGEPVSTETPRSERAEREATIMQQQETQQQAEAQVEQTEVPSEEGPIAGVTEVGEIDFGHRDGLPYLRNSVGDPDAPVVIVEYSDFQ